MNSIVVISVSALIFIWAYRFYASKIEAIWEINPDRKTPAYTKEDGLDYIPAKNWLVLFGHHFSSIAGAGPIVGPVIAVCIWGWVPAFIWVVFGSIFLGGIHDFGSLMISVREEGTTLGDIAKTAISVKAKIVLSIFTFLALILVIAVFAYFGASTFVQQPEIVVPSLGVIPLAVLVGLFLYRLKYNSIGVTIFALIILVGLIIAGQYFPITFPSNGLAIWMVVLLIYCFIASVIPVNFLLQPRDYLSSYLLVAGIVFAFFGILVSHPTMNTPAFIANKGSLGYLWPMMFITIACGANSGFHSLISTGTTSKQLSNERYAKRIAFGSMLLEGFLATLVIVIIVSGFSLAEFKEHIAQETSPVNMYGIGYGNVTKGILGPWGMFFALTVLNAFILTTLDSATRITRYIAEELFHIKNRCFSTSIIILIAGFLALGKDNADTPLWKIIWPAFGASNQLVAALALLVISCWLLRKNKPVYYSLLPSIFMLVTSITALIFQIFEYWIKGQFLLIIISMILIGSAAYLTNESLNVLFRLLKAKK